MSYSLLQHCQRRLAAMELDRSSYQTHWMELSQYVLPRKGRFFQDAANQQGKKKHQKIINSTATLASRTLAAGFATEVTSPARPWFRMSVSNPGLADNSGVRIWLDDVTRILLDLLGRSNFYTAVTNCYHELGVFGTMAMAMLEDADEVVRFYPFTIGTYYLASSYKMRVDSFAQKYQLSVAQLLAKFGDKCPDSVRRAHDAGKFDQMYDVAQLIEPNIGRDIRYADNQNLPFRSITYLTGCPDGQEPLEVSGFEEFPILVGRWDVMSDGAYGSGSPGMETLSDIRHLQYLELQSAKTLDMINEPSVQGPTQIKDKRNVLLPGSTTYTPPNQNGGKFEPIYVPDPRAFQFTDSKIDALERRIRRGFFEDLFLMLANASDTTQRTAAEIAERKQEKMQVVGPVLKRLDDDCFDPMVERLFSIALRRGLLPEPPQELQGNQLKIEYISILAQAQKMVSTGSIERIAMFTAQLAAIYPDSVDKFNPDEAIDQYSDSVGGQARLIRSDDDVAQIRDARAKQQQMQMMAAMAKPMQDATGALKNLGETRMDEGTMAGNIAQAIGAQ